MAQDIANNSDISRTPDGRFRPGFGGRQKGSRNKISRSTLAGVQALSSEAVGQLAIKMREGDMTAIRYILDYTLPRGGRTIDLDTSQPNTLIDAATSGEISPDEFARIAQGWKTASDAADLKDLKHQVDQLELLISSLKK